MTSKAEAQQALERIEKARRVLDANVERVRAELVASEPEWGPPHEFEAAIAKLISDLDASAEEARARYDALQAEMEQQLKDQ